MAKEQILTRLRKVEGQVRGLQRMIAQDRECEAVLTQLMAARAALDKIALSIAGEHLDLCVDALLDQPDGRARILRTMELFLKLSPSIGDPEINGECEPCPPSESESG